MVGDLSNLTAYENFCHGIIFAVVVTERRKEVRQNIENWIK